MKQKSLEMVQVTFPSFWNEIDFMDLILVLSTLYIYSNKLTKKDKASFTNLFNIYVHIHIYK